MSLETAVWRRFPVRGGGRVVIPALERRAARATVVAQGPFGTRIEVDPRDEVGLAVYLWGTYAPEAEAAIGRLLQAGATALDAGAGTGVSTVLMAARCRPGRVLAVESSAANRASIGRQAERNGLSAEVEIVGGDPTRLDELISPGGLPGGRLALVRIVVGGTEPAVLRGARGLLARTRPPLLFDWCPESWSAVGETPAGAAAVLDEFDYELFAPVLAVAPRWSAGPPRFERFSPVPLAALRDGKLPTLNLVAIAAGAHGAGARARLAAS
jgi:hypothetical protein